MWYKWAALPSDISAVPVAMGITDDEQLARAAAAAVLLADSPPFPRAFLAYIQQVTFVTGADLSRQYVPTGLEWRGQRTGAGTVKWCRMHAVTTS